MFDTPVDKDKTNRDRTQFQNNTSRQHSVVDGGLGQLFNKHFIEGDCEEFEMAGNAKI